MTKFKKEQYDLKKKKFLKSYKKHLGIVKFACEEAKISRGAYYIWYNNDPEFKKACDDIKEEAIDVVEDALLKNITDAKDTKAMVFYLKTQGKERGYVEKSELDVSINPFLQLMRDLPDEPEDV